MRLRCLSFSLGLTLPLAAQAAAPQPPDLVGTWTCGPYEMQGIDLTISATDHRVYTADGHYTEHGFATYTGTDIQVRTETRHAGTWSLQGDLIEVQLTSSMFLSSDHPAVTVAQGQATLDALMKRKSWEKKRILQFDGQSMVTIPVEALDKQAEVQVSCSRG